MENILNFEFDPFGILRGSHLWCYMAPSRPHFVRLGFFFVRFLLFGIFFFPSTSSSSSFFGGFWGRLSILQWRCVMAVGLPLARGCRMLIGGCCAAIPIVWMTHRVDESCLQAVVGPHRTAVCIPQRPVGRPDVDVRRFRLFFWTIRLVGLWLCRLSGVHGHTSKLHLSGKGRLRGA